MGRLRGAVAHDTSATPRTQDVLLSDSTTFADFLLSEKTLQGLHASGFLKPSPIQLAALPVGRLGIDLIVQAKSGTGKTLVFGIIALEMIDLSISRPQVLILAPTREIAAQIKEVISSIAIQFTGLKVDMFIGGLSVQRDVEEAKTCQIVVGTPGRIKQLVKEGALNLRAVRLFVLDEADRLMESSFRTDVKHIFKRLPEMKQTLVVSATFPPEMETYLSKFLVTPRRISPSADTLLLGLRQFVLVTKYHTSALVQVRNKTAALLKILSSISFRQCLVFCNIQSRMGTIVADLAGLGWPALYLAGSMSQTQRLATLAALQTHRCRVLLSTDLASRGVDAEQVDLVVNMDLPYDTATFLHRVGRAGRFGAAGVAVSIVSSGNELTKLQNILYDVGGPNFQVAKLPDDNLTNQVWLPDAELEKISSIPRQEEDNTEEKGSTSLSEPEKSTVEVQIDQIKMEDAITMLKKCHLDDKGDLGLPPYKDLKHYVNSLKLAPSKSLNTEKTEDSTKDLNISMKSLRLDETDISNGEEDLEEESESQSVNNTMNSESEDQKVTSMNDNGWRDYEDYYDYDDSGEYDWGEEEYNSNNVEYNSNKEENTSNDEEYNSNNEIDNYSCETNSSDDEVVVHKAKRECLSSPDEDCSICSSWFREWRSQLTVQRLNYQSQIYMEEMLKF